MKRRTFIRLAGLVPALGFPLVGTAAQSRALMESRAVIFEDSPSKRPDPRAIIKVVGIGGAGGNAVERMIQDGLQGVEFICANTDADSLLRSSAATKLQFGSGLGSDGQPELARNLAVAERKRIAELLEGTNMVFIVAGMGGGTGTGASPVVAEVARQMGILTVAVATTPFEFEGGRRLDVGWHGLWELKQRVDALILVPQDSVHEALGDDVSFDDALRFIDLQIKNVVGCITETINVPGLMNLDFATVHGIVNQAGLCVMGSAIAGGFDRAILAADNAMHFPSMRAIQPARRRHILFSVTAGRSLGIQEFSAVAQTIRRHTFGETLILGGATYDDSMKDQLRVTVIAVGDDRA